MHSLSRTEKVFHLPDGKHQDQPSASVPGWISNGEGGVEDWGFAAFFSGVGLGAGFGLSEFEVFLLSSGHSCCCGLVEPGGRFFLSSAKEKDPIRIISKTINSFVNLFRFVIAFLTFIPFQGGLNKGTIPGGLQYFNQSLPLAIIRKAKRAITQDGFFVSIRRPGYDILFPPVG